MSTAEIKGRKQKKKKTEGGAGAGAKSGTYRTRGAKRGTSKGEKLFPPAIVGKRGASETGKKSTKNKTGKRR